MPVIVRVTLSRTAAPAAAYETWPLNASARSFAPIISRTRSAEDSAPAADGSEPSTSAEVAPAAARFVERASRARAYRGGEGRQPHAVPAGTDSPSVTTVGSAGGAPTEQPAGTRARTRT